MIDSQNTTAEVGVPAFDWNAWENPPDMSWVGSYFMIVGAFLLFRFVSALIGLYWACTSFWFIALLVKNGVGVLLINPLYCIFAPMIVGGLTYVILTMIGEAIGFPGRVYGKITR